MVLQSHVESYFRALVLFSEAPDMQFKEIFAVEADVSQTTWDPEVGWCEAQLQVFEVFHIITFKSSRQGKDFGRTHGHTGKTQ